MMMTPDSVLNDLHAWSVTPADDGARYSLETFRGLVHEYGEGALFKGGHPMHLTSSLFVLSTDLTEVLLTFHKKAEMWLQFGGHLEREDASLAAAAWREGSEESGLEAFADFSPIPSDIDIHELGGGFGAICREHWDVGFVALAERDAVVVVSDESHDVRWFPVDQLPDSGAGDMNPRVRTAVNHARSHF
ncbi:MAG: NUDIX domain-containing protein [Trueperella sp.]|nr:NUDIX domain-containing protein [Trueperella sp.]